MTILQRALKSLIHHKRRSILFFVVYSAVFSVLMIMVIANIASSMQIEDTQEAIGNSVYISKARVDDIYSMDNVGRFSDLEIETLTEDERVDSYNVLIKQYGNLRGIDPVMDKEKYEDSLQILEEIHFDTTKLDNCTFIGVTDSQRAVFFAGSGFRLIAGSPLTQVDEKDKSVLISSDLAKLNGLKVGDEIQLATTKWYNMVTPVEFSARIKGIYEIPDETFARGTETYSPEMMLENYIFIPETTIVQVDPSQYQPYFVFAYLKEPEMIETYIADMKEILGDTTRDLTQTGWKNEYRYRVDEQWNELVSTPMKEIHNVTNAAMWIILIGVLAVVFLISSGEIRQKGKEFGIWLACGEKKSRILVQTLIEKMIPIVAGIIVATIVAFSVTDTISSQIVGGIPEEMNRQLESDRDETLFWEGIYYMEREIRLGNYNFYYLSDSIDIYRSRGAIAGAIGASCVVITGLLASQIWYTLRHRPSELLCSEE